MLKVLLSSILFLWFIGCGGGSDEPSSHKEDVTLRTLYFIDSPVNGITYHCGIREGVTQTDQDSGKHGAFYCKDESVTFSLGTLTIGTIEQFVNGEEIHPQNFVNETPHDYFSNEDVLKLAMLLQSLDDDEYIEEYINILPETVSRLQITSLENLSMQEVEEEIRRVGKNPREFNAMREHLIRYSHIPEIDPYMTFVVDNKEVGTPLTKPLDIKNPQYITKIDIVDEEYKNYFEINSTGYIWLKKRLNFRQRNQFTFKIQAVTPLGSSNVATVTINVDSAIEGENNSIHKPVISQSTIYTNTDEYQVTISGRKGTDIYIDGQKIQTMPNNQIVTLTRESQTQNGTVSHNVILRYDNGLESEPVSFSVIKDTIAPIIEINTSITVDENIEVIDTININEINDYGLRYELSGVDAQYFELSNNGKLSFSTSIDFDNPMDSNGDNRYEITITVIDIAGNRSLPKHITISIGDILNSPPIITPIDSIDISTDLTVGSTVQTISISDGNSTVTDLYLEGVGKEYFDIHSNGEIILMSRITTATTFNLTVVAVNEFGTTRQPITINVGSVAKAKAQIEGGLANATVKLIELDSNNQQTLLDTQITDALGNFDLKIDKVNSSDFYIYEISGGTDTNNHQTNRGVIRLIAKGAWLQNATAQIRVTPLSEMLYDYVAQYIKYDYAQLEGKLGESAKILLTDDLTSDYNIDAKDIMVFNPSNNLNNIYSTLKYNDNYQSIVDKIFISNNSYIQDLFNAKVIKSFADVEDWQNSSNLPYHTDIQFSGSIAYFFKDNTFYTYDMYNQTSLGSLILEKQDLSGIDPITLLLSEPNMFDVQIYLDLEYNRVYVENLNQKTFIIDVSNLREPRLLGHFNRIWGSFIKLSINNTIYMQSSLVWQDNFSVYDVTNPNNVIALNDMYINRFTDISGTRAYNFSILSCNDSDIRKQFTIEAYNLQDIYNRNSNKDIYTIDTQDCYKEAYFNNDYVYIYSYDNNLEIYQLVQDSSTVILINNFPLMISKILNYDNKILYVYSNNYIYFIDTTDIYNLKIEKKILYKYKYNSSSPFIDTDNLKITIKDNFIVESSRLIDLNSHILSSIYTETESGINMTLFNKFNN